MTEPTDSDREQARKILDGRAYGSVDMPHDALVAIGLATNRARAESLEAAQKAAREALFKAGRCGDGNVAALITRALEEVAADTRADWYDEQQRVMSIFSACWRELGDAEGELSDAIQRLRAERDALSEALRDVILMRGADCDLWGKEWGEWVKRNRALLNIPSRFAQKFCRCPDSVLGHYSNSCPIHGEPRGMNG